jgi:hypothetical protein
MNDFASTLNSGLLKDAYNPEKPAESDLKVALKRRKAKLIDQGSVAENPDYNSDDSE